MIHEWRLWSESNRRFTPEALNVQMIDSRDCQSLTMVVQSI